MCQSSSACIADSEATRQGNIYIVLCASGFDFPQRMRSALMFASLAASAEMHAVLYCVQNAVDVMVKGSIEKNEAPEPGCPTLLSRLQEAMDLGVHIQCCTQTMNNRGVGAADLIDGVEPAGAMSLIGLTSKATGSICF